MCADRDSSPSPGFRALLGRFLHGLLQYRVFQLFGAAWSYLMGLTEASLWSLLPSAWVVHRSVGPDEFPEMLEVLRLQSGSWEELGDRLEEMGPWKQFLPPAMKEDLEMMNQWTGFVSSSKEQESWHSTMWEPGLGAWKDVQEDQEEDELYSKSSANNSYTQHKIHHENGQCHLDEEKNGARLHSSPLGMVSCIFNQGSAGVFTWIDLGNNHNLQDKDVHDETAVPVEHVRNKRLWFLQQNHSQDVPTSDLKKDENVEEPSQSDQDVLSALHKLGLSVSAWHDGRGKDVSPERQLSSAMELTGPDPEAKPCPPLSLLVPKPYISGNSLNKSPPSPDQDQGYHSLEDWQCLNIKQSLWNNADDGAQVPTELSCPVVEDLPADQNSDDMDSDLEEEIHAPDIPVCTNKHIGYILGTVVSDDEAEPNSSDDDDWDEDDDGFDSEGSVSATESDVPVAEEVVLWNSFCSPDPYNPQNFTASLQTGPIAEVTSHPEDQDAVISDEESWCDSDAVSDSDSEDEYSADEEENLKLWNGFLRSEDPYNPLSFKASVQTSERKGQNGDSATGRLELVCTGPSSCELTVSIHPNDSQLLRLREKHSVSKEKSANVGHKKVSFYDKVIVYYVCNKEERKGHWEEFARDRCRFQRRIQETESMIGHCFTPDHRQRVLDRMQEIWGS